MIKKSGRVVITKSEITFEDFMLEDVDGKLVAFELLDWVSKQVTKRKKLLKKNLKEWENINP